MSDARTPRYALVARELLGQIAAGRYDRGALLPTEQALCERFGVSRITVRAAMRELETRGLISRHPGVGTRVEATAPVERFVHAADSVNAILQYQDDLTFKLIETREVEADGALAESLGVPPGQALVYAEGLRVRKGEPPLCLAQLHFPVMYGSIARRLGGHRGSIALLLEREFGERVAEIRQVIDAENLRAHEARLLDASARDAALLVRRWHLGADGRLLLAATSLFPKGRYAYALRMRREGAPDARASRRAAPRNTPDTPLRRTRGKQ